MNHKTEKKMVGYGCLAVLIGICTFAYLAFASHGAYSAGVVGFISLGWLHVKLADRRDYLRHIKILKLAFADVEIPVPQLKQGNHYGFPHFTLTFPSEAELKQAEMKGCIIAFKQEIQTLYENIGGKEKPFDIEKAVWVTYQGWQFPDDASHFKIPNNQ